MVLILRLSWKKQTKKETVWECEMRANKRVTFRFLLRHKRNLSQGRVKAVEVWVGRDRNNVTAEVERKSEKLAEKRGGRKKTQLSYILAHHLPRVGWLPLQLIYHQDKLLPKCSRKPCKSSQNHAGHTYMCTSESTHTHMFTHSKGLNRFSSISMSIVHSCALSSMQV